VPASSEYLLANAQPSRKPASPLSGLEIYGRNLAALQATQPSVALAVNAVPIPHGIEETVGRDGTRTFLLTDDAGRRTWFGGSSMPSVSAPEMFSNLSGDGGNMSLPGILTGFEPLVIGERLPRHCAVFVVEENPSCLKLAMHLYDYSTLLESGRLAFVLSDDLTVRLVEFFEHHPGYTLPTQMFTVPQRSPAQIAVLQRRFEQAGEAVISVQARVVESCAEAIRRRTLGRLPALPHVALLSVDPSAINLENARRIERALNRLGGVCEVCVPDVPDKCHVAARIQAIERASADLVLILNGSAGAMRPLIPRQLPVAARYFAGAGITPILLSQVGPHDMFFGSSTSQCKALVAAGAPPTAVALCEPGADDVLFHPFPSPDDERVSPRASIAVLMDLPDDRPEACGINLPSHVSLWQALKETTQERVDHYEVKIAEELLDAAQRASGTTLIEPASREQFLSFLRTRIAPATRAQADGKALMEAGYIVAVWGENWPATGTGADPRRGPMPCGEKLNRIFNAAECVVLPWMSPTTVRLALDALASGAIVILRSSQESFLTEHPGLSSVVGFLSFYRTRSELTDVVRQLKAQDGVRRVQAVAAVAEVRNNHSVASRLVSIVHRLRERQG